MSPRAFVATALILAAAGLWASWCEVAMIWDGAYQFCSSINAGHAFAYLSRFHSWIVWQPMMWLTHFTDNLTILKFAYGAPYCFAPLAGLLLSWWIVRKTAPHLMIWAVFGIAMGALPGQVFMINDSVFQVHLFWPVFLAAFLPLTRLQAVAIAILSLFQLSHPIGILLCGMMAAALLLFSFKSVEAALSRRDVPPVTDDRNAHLLWTGWYALLAIGGVAKLFLWPDAYAAREATPEHAWLAFRWGVLWWPFFALVAAWIAASMIAWVRFRPTSSERTVLRWAPVALLGFAGVCLIYWAFQPILWQTALNYRRWLVPMCFPFMVLAGWELWQNVRSSEGAPVFTQKGRDRAGIILATIFLLVLGVQSQTWHNLFSRLTAQVNGWQNGLWIKESDLAWTKQTPMDHWGISSQIIVAQGRCPHVMLWSDEVGPVTYDKPARIAFSTFNTFAPAEVPRSWFDWSAVLREAGSSNRE